MSSAIFFTIFLSLACLHMYATAPVTPSPDDRQTEEKIEAKLVAEIVHDLLAKVAQAHLHTQPDNSTETLDEVWANENATQSTIEMPATSLRVNNSQQPDAAIDEDGAIEESDDEIDEEDDIEEDVADDIPLSHLDPGSEYVLQVFEKLQKGNSMEAATKELTTKLSREHRRKIRSCNTVLSLPGSVANQDEPSVDATLADATLSDTKNFKTGGKIIFDLNALKSRNDKLISKRLALLALTINADASPERIPKVFYSTTFKMTGNDATHDEEDDIAANVNETSTLPEEDTASRRRRSATADPIVETFRETRVFKMDESRSNELWLDITREIPRWKRAFNDPESVMEITVTYFLPGGDVMSNEISVSTEDASLVIFSKDDQKLEELQQKSEESETKASANEVNETHEVNKHVERRKRSTEGLGLGSSARNENHSSPTLFSSSRLRKRRGSRKNGGGRRRRLNKRRRNKASGNSTPRRGPRVETQPQVKVTAEDEAQKRKKGLCHLQKYTIDFEVLGWDTWIIYPKKYNAFTCGGECTSPVMQSLHPTNHGLLQSLMEHKTGKSANGKEHLCCVPSKLSPLSMLYMENGMVVTRHHPDMIVDQCACR